MVAGLEAQRESGTLAHAVRMVAFRDQSSIGQPGYPEQIGPGRTRPVAVFCHGPFQPMDNELTNGSAL